MVYAIFNHSVVYQINNKEIFIIRLRLFVFKKSYENYVIEICINIEHIKLFKIY